MPRTAPGSLILEGGHAEIAAQRWFNALATGWVCDRYFRRGQALKPGASDGNLDRKVFRILVSRLFQQQA